jgi:DNA primase
MRYPPSLLDEIRSRVPVSAVVGRRVKLTKAGREWKGLSPFNAERTPSFFVNDQKQRYFDFSSGKNGNIFDFLIETEGLSFPEAVERLAAEAGVPLPKFSPEMEAREKKIDSLVEVMELAAKFFEAKLADRVGSEARRYLLGRDLQPDVQKQFRLGYAPGDRFSLRDHLAEKGVTSEAMIEAGLLIHGDDIAVPYDRFRDRVMFPIMDARGRVIAFGGRALQADAQAKYLNSPETPLFHKGATLYNLHRARKAAHDKGTVIAVEGYVDVIAMCRAGFDNSVAPLGTALTEEQLAMLWRMVPEPVLFFDGDKAGQRAAHRAIDVALPALGAGRTLRFAFMAGGKDPDELLRASGPEALRAVVAKTESFADVLFAREVARTPLDTPERKADLRRRLLDCVKEIKDEILREAYRSDMLERLRAQNQAAQPAGRNPGQPQGNRRMGPLRGFVPTGPVAPSSELLRSPLFTPVGIVASQREAAIMLAAFNHPQLIDRDIEAFADLPFSTRALQQMQSALVDLASEGHTDATGVAKVIAERGHRDILDALKQQVNVSEWWTRADAPIHLVERAFSESVDLHRKVSSLHRARREAEQACLEEGTESAFERLKEIVLAIEVLESPEEEEAFTSPARGRP